MAEAFSGDVWRSRYLEVSPRLSYEDVLRQALEYEQNAKEYPETSEGRDGEKFARQFVEDVWGSPKALQAGKYGDHILKSDVVLRLPEAGTFAALQVSVADPGTMEGHARWDDKKIYLARNPAPYVGALVPPEIRSQLTEKLPKANRKLTSLWLQVNQCRCTKLLAARLSEVQSTNLALLLLARRKLAKTQCFRKLLKWLRRHKDQKRQSSASPISFHHTLYPLS